MTKTIRLTIEFRGTEPQSGSALHCICPPGQIRALRVHREDNSAGTSCFDDTLAAHLIVGRTPSHAYLQIDKE